MPFELKNTPETFQRAMSVFLATVRWQSALVDLDDIVMSSKLPKDHIEQVRRVLRSLNKNGMTLKLKKSKLLADIIDYSGHVIRPGRLEHAEHTIDAVMKLKHRTTQTELRSFLILCNVCRRFVPTLVHIAAPANK